MSVIDARRDAAEPKRVRSADAPVAPSAPEIPYERQPPGAVPRWWLRLIALLLLLNVVATTSISWGPVVVESARRALAERRAAAAKAQSDAAAAAAEAAAARQKKALQARAAAYAVPDGQALYTEDPAEAERLLSDLPAYAVVPASNPTTLSGLQVPHPAVEWVGPPELERLLGSLMLPRRGATVFLHERRTPSGRRVIVWCAVEAERHVHAVQYGDERQVTVDVERRLVTRLVHPLPEERNAWQHVLSVHQPAERKLNMRFDAGGKSADHGRGVVTQQSPVMRFVAGRADPQDATHFEVHYTIDGRPGTIDGWVREDGRLRIEPRQGVKTVQKFDTDGLETWDPHARTAAPTTRPASE